MRLKVPPGSTNDIVSCLIFINKRNDYEIDFVSEIIEIIPENMQLNNPAKLSFNLDIISNQYNTSKLSIYKLDNDMWILCDSYIQDNFIHSEINTFGKYAVVYDENNQTDIFPNEYMLIQNYPNPFNPETSITYYLPAYNFIEINVYNIEGKKVNTLYKGYSESGYHTIHWNGKNNQDVSLPSGVYILSLEYDNNILNNKMVKIK